MPDFVTLLTEDHRRVEQLFKQFDETGDPAVAQQIFLELTVHSTIEEELLYGLYASKVDGRGAAEARQEHMEAKDLIVQLNAMEPGSDEFVTTMTKLKTAVLHHVDEEENEFFPKFVKALPETAEILGNDLATRRVEVEKQIAADREIGLPPPATTQKTAARRETAR
jgi:hemerythrin-like domain-containing protein